MSIWTNVFWKDAAERALKTFAQVMASFLVAGTTGLLDVDWLQAGSISLVAAAASVLTSIASSNIAHPGDASLVSRK